MHSESIARGFAKIYFHPSSGVSSNAIRVIIHLMSEAGHPLRLRKKHGSGVDRDVTPIDGKRLADAQSVGNALLAGMLAVIVFSVFWVAISAITNRVFPWLTVFLGYLIGFAVRIAGRGIDWRFPLIAALLAVAGSFLANVVVAASVTAEELGTGTLQILPAVTSMTWPVFFDEVLTFADAFYALAGAGLAAFNANRRLTRAQYHALRLWSGGHQ